MKAYVITLESKLSLELGGEALAASRFLGVDSVIFPGIHGHNSIPYFKAHGISKFLDRTIINRVGHQGCFLSHFLLWLLCIEANEPIMVLEHDGIMIRPLPLDCIDNFTDILRLDAHSVWKPDYESLLKVDSPLYHKPEPHFHHTSGGYCVGAYGYLIKPSGAMKLVTHARKRGASCTEVHMGMDIVDIVSTSQSIVRLHSHYCTLGLEDSMTHNLGGISKIPRSSYISPLMYKRMFT